MNRKEIREALSHLTALVEGWCDGREAGTLERELALEKLRAIYEAIRFAEAPAQPVETAAVPVPQEVAVPDAVAEPAAESEPEPAPEPEAFAPDMLPVEPEELPEMQPEETEAPAAAPQAAEQPAAEPTAVAPEAESEPEPEPESAPEPESEPEPEKPLETPVEPVVPAAEPETVRKTTLFDPEEDEAMRHRRKQRVIMSLYGAAPEEPAAPADPEPEPDKWAGLVEHIEHPDRPLRPEPEQEGEVTFEEISVETVVVEPAEPEATVEPEREKEPEQQPVPVPDPAVAAAPVPAFEPEPEPVLPPQPEPVPAADPAPAVAPVAMEPEPMPEQPAPVLGEVINHDVQTLADTIEAPRQVVSDLLRHEAVRDIRHAIVLNDKLLLIRDLFGGDADAYEREMQRFNEFDNLDDCMIYIAENHAGWNPHAESVQLLMELLERKFA